MTYYALFRRDGLSKRHLGLTHCMNPLSSVCRTHVESGTSSHPRCAVMPEKLVTLFRCLVWAYRRWDCGMDDGYEAK